jgi:hypothetical protein
MKRGHYALMRVTSLFTLGCWLLFFVFSDDAMGSVDVSGG